MPEKYQLVHKKILVEPTHYFTAQSKTLKERLSAMSLSEEETAEIATTKAKGIIRDKVLGLFKIGDIINTILTWNEQVDQDMRKAKKEYLLANFIERTEQNELAISALKEFLSSPQGNTLFNKILRILDDSPPDLELANHLAHALRYIVDTNFAAMFEAHRYALAQIEQLTPQALTILADYVNWPQMKLGSFSTSGPKVTSDWLTEFTRAYVSIKGISDSGVADRVKHSINVLIAGRFIEAHIVKGSEAKCVLTDVGKMLLPYVGNGIGVAS